jgi:signal transduction histidine kinase
MDRPLGPRAATAGTAIRIARWLRRWDLTPPALMRAVIAVGLMAVAVDGLELLRPISVDSPGARVAIETMIVLGALVSFVLLWVHFERSRELRDLLLLGVLATVGLTDFVFSVLPALADAGETGFGSGARLASDALVAATVAAAAFAPRGRLVTGGRRLVLIAILAGVGVVVSAELVRLFTAAQWTPNSTGRSGLAAALGYPVALALHAGAGLVLTIAGVAFVVRAPRDDTQSLLLAGASFLLAGARLQYLAVPAVAPDWVTPREGFRLAAYGLLLVAACLEYAKARRYATEAALDAERQRIARDLHDGLAQDLAFIAGQGERLELKLGPEHPLTIAARRALAVSRGAITDLSASAAHSTEAALREVARELGARFAVQVDVRVDRAAGGGDARDFDPERRDELVRIAREAIVNAARHGGARHIEIVLGRNGSDRLLQVSDDGCGLADTSRPGFGMHSMRARARSLGARLNAGRGANGGTELDVLVS